MASKFLKKRVVPEGFHQVLCDLTREILREQPYDIIHYSACYFEHYLSQTETFKYDKNHEVESQDPHAIKRKDTSTSHNTEKIISSEYMQHLYDFGIQKFEEEIDGGYNDDEKDFGELLINIVSAKDLITEDSNAETYCVAFLSADPIKIIKTQNSYNAKNPKWDHQDKLILRNINEHELLESLIIFQIYNNENGKKLIGEASVSLDFALAQPGEWELKLNDSEGKEGFGVLHLLVNFIKDNQLIEEEEDQEDESEYKDHNSEDD